MSKDLLSVGTLSASHGQKRYGVNEFLIAGQPYRLPMWLINGAGEGPTLVVTAGVHAAEYASIAAALELGQLPNHKLAHIRSYDGKHGRRELFRAWDGAWKKTTTFSIIKGS